VQVGPYDVDVSLEEEATRSAAELDAAEAARVKELGAAWSALATAVREFVELARANTIPTVRISNASVRERKSWLGKSTWEPMETTVADGWLVSRGWGPLRGTLIASTDGRLFTQVDESWAEKRTDFVELTEAHTQGERPYVLRPDIDTLHKAIRDAATAMVRGRYRQDYR
jgi:hypothetical protein